MALLAAVALLLGTSGAAAPSGCTPDPAAAAPAAAAAGGEASAAKAERTQLSCTDGKVLLTKRDGKVVEAFVEAAGEDDQAATAQAVDELLKQPVGDVEIAQLRYYNARRIEQATLSLGSFSWDALPGHAYEDKLKVFAERERDHVVLSPSVRMALPEAGDVRLAVTTFVFGGAHAEGPGLSIVHVLGENGKPLGRIDARFVGSFGSLPGSFSPLALNSKESALKYASGYTGQGFTSDVSDIYRVDLPGKKLVKLALAEASSNNQGSPSCQAKGVCREVRYALAVSEKQPKKAEAYTFKIVRTETRHKKTGEPLKTTTKVYGSCVYNAKAADYRCPKLPKDAST